MRQRCNVYDFSYLNPCTMHGTDCRLTAITRTFHVCLYLTQAKVVSYFCAILGSHLGCIRSVLLRATETHLSCRRP